jgi:hypothetical protein
MFFILVETLQKLQFDAAKLGNKIQTANSSSIFLEIYSIIP